MGLMVTLTHLKEIVFMYNRIILNIIYDEPVKKRTKKFHFTVLFKLKILQSRKYYGFYKLSVNKSLIRTTANRV